MKLLADQYKGEVQFAYIDAMKFRNLELAFGVKLLPTSFLYKDGIWYESIFMQILVNNIRNFINERYLWPDVCMTKFETPKFILPLWMDPVIMQYNKA